MDFDQLHAFLEIVRLKSFSKAARSCFRTQPAISAQIRQMEQELDTQLFERFGNRISLTAAGKVFATYAQKILDTKREGVRYGSGVGACTPRRGDDRGERGNLCERAAAGFLELQGEVPPRAIAGDSLLRIYDR